MNTCERRPRPYVGVSGVVTYENIQPSGLAVRVPQQLFVEARAEKAGLYATDRLLALGVKATHKTQFQDRENKYGREWYPVGEQEFAGALDIKDKHPHTLGVAQTYLDIHHVADAGYRKRFMRRIAERGRSWLQAVQFDMLPWDDNDDMFDFLDKLRTNHPNLQVLLQCHGPAMEQLGEKGVAQKLGRHAHLLNYVLFDSSHGTGTHMDARRLGGFLYEAYASEPLDRVGFAVAGGLNAQNISEDLPALLAKYPDLSWDAEGQLHPLNNAGKRPLQLDAVEEYLRASVGVINS